MNWVEVVHVGGARQGGGGGTAPESAHCAEVLEMIFLGEKKSKFAFVIRHSLTSSASREI